MLTARGNRRAILFIPVILLSRHIRLLRYSVFHHKSRENTMLNIGNAIHQGMRVLHGQIVDAPMPAGWLIFSFIRAFRYRGEIR